MTTFDTITTTSGVTYGFIGSQYMVIGQNGIADGYPRDIQFDLGMPADLDASLSLPTEYEYFQYNGRWYRRVKNAARTYFFKVSSRTFYMPSNVKGFLASRI